MWAWLGSGENVRWVVGVWCSNLEAVQPKGVLQELVERGDPGPDLGCAVIGLALCGGGGHHTVHAGGEV